MISLQSKYPSEKIGNLCDVFRGSSPRPINNQDYFVGGEIPWVKIADATASGKYLYKTKQYVNEYGASFSRYLPAGTLLVAASGTLGYTQFLGVPGCAHDGWLILDNFINLDKDYLYYVLHLLQNFFYNAAYGAAIQNINTNILKNTEIPFPRYEIQKKIACILSNYDNLIENNTRRIEILEEMAQLIYREWFVHYRFPGYEQVKMVDSGTEFGEIPEGWEVLPLSELVETQYGYTTSAQNEPIGPKFLRGMDINKSSYIDWSSVPYCEIPDNVIDKFQLKIGDIVIIRMADPGKVGIIEQEVNAIFASYLVRLIIKTSRISPYFLFYFLNDEKYQGYITGASTGTTRKSASAGVLVGVDILCPSTKIMDEYNAQISSLRDLMNNLIMQNNNLRTTRDLLLPKLISGEIDVSDLDIETA